jgi:hypothetical protein
VAEAPLIAKNAAPNAMMAAAAILPDMPMIKSSSLANSLFLSDAPAHIVRKRQKKLVRACRAKSNARPKTALKNESRASHD